MKPVNNGRLVLVPVCRVAEFLNAPYWPTALIAQVYLKAGADNNEDKPQNQTPFNQQGV